MQKLDQYLDQVCRTIGGPFEMRQHLREELREHLLDAVAQHKAAGLSDEDALQKALDEFGKPDEVRTELEAAHGQRMTWIIDKAMQWKEKTMKAKWLWTTWAHLGLMLVIALDALFITFNVVFIIPKYQKLMHDGIIHPTIMEEDVPRRMVNFLHDLQYTAGNHTLLYLVVPALIWGLFEWRVRSDNKTMMRLSALGTAAVGLTVVVGLMAGSLAVTFCLGAPAVGRLARPFAADQVGKINAEASAVEQALAKKDWEAMKEPVERATQTIDGLIKMEIAVRQLASRPGQTAADQQSAVVEISTKLASARDSLQTARKAIDAKDSQRMETALAEFRKSFEPVREASRKMPR